MPLQKNSSHVRVKQPGNCTFHEGRKENGETLTAKTEADFASLGSVLGLWFGQPKYGANDISPFGTQVKRHILLIV